MRTTVGQVVPRRNACAHMSWGVVPLQAHNDFWLCRLVVPSHCAQPLRTTPAHNRTDGTTSAHQQPAHNLRTTTAHNLRAQHRAQPPRTTTSAQPARESAQRIF